MLLWNRGLVLGAIALVGAGSLIAQESKTTTTKNTVITVQSPAKGSKANDDKPSRRLPNYYGQLDLTDEQKTKVYAVQDKYEGQIDALEKQIEDLKAKRAVESEAVLTADQKKKLLTAMEEAKAKGKAKKKAATEKADAKATTK